MKRKWVSILLLAFTLLWIALIFFNSTENGTSSGAKSDAVKEVVDQVVEKLGDDDGVSAVAVRKSAHVLEFMVLGILICLDVQAWGLLHFPLSARRILVLSGGILVCGTLVAVLDEFLQSFAEGRVASGWDVLIDFGGLALGMLLFAAAYVPVCKRRQKVAAKEGAVREETHE